MSQRSTRITVATTTLVAAAAVGSLLLWPETQDPAVLPEPGPRESQASLFDVDATGAIVGTPTTIQGVSRDSRVAWQRELSDFSHRSIVCAGACPAGVMSSDSLNLQSPMVPDPAPTAVGGSRVPKGLGEPTGGKSTIVTASHGSTVRLSSDATGTAFWTVASPAGLRRFSAPGTVVDWYETSTGDAALAAVTNGPVTEQRPWAIVDGAWRPVGRPTTWAEGFGCVAAGGRAWINDGKTIARPRGGAVPLHGLSRLSNCAFTRNSVVTVSYARHGETPETRLQVFGLDGHLQRELMSPDTELRLTGDASGEEFALVGAGKARIYSSRGEELGRIDDVVAALYDETGTLVTVDADGHVRWRRDFD